MSFHRVGRPRSASLTDAGYILQPLTDMAAIEFLLSGRVIGQYHNIM
jgi:hypothetical protein